MSERAKVHYLLDNESEHVPWQEALLLDSESICALARRLRTEVDVIYVNPPWTPDRIVFHGVSDKEFGLEIQKATEAAYYERDFLFDELPEIVASLRSIFADPLSYGLARGRF